MDGVDYMDMVDGASLPGCAARFRFYPGLVLNRGPSDSVPVGTFDPGSACACGSAGAGKFDG